MALRITLRRADLEILAAMDKLVEESDDLLSTKQRKAWSSLQERILRAEMKPAKAVSSLTVVQAIDIFRGALGRRLIVPAGTPDALWFVMLQKRINSSGLTADLARRAAEVAGAQWKGPIKAESIIRQADVLLSEALITQMGEDLREESVDMVEL